MAKTTPYASPSRPHRTSKHSQALMQSSGKYQKTETSSPTNHSAENSRHVAAETLSDWHRKSLAATPSHYQSEHRRERRQQSKLEVRLKKQGKPLGETRTFDLNSRGIGVECNELALHIGEVVEVDLPENGIPEDMDSHAYCLVVYAGEHCGLMYLDQNNKSPKK